MVILKRFFLLILLSLSFIPSFSQEWYKLHMGYDGGKWAFPYSTNEINSFSFNENSSLLKTQLTDNEDFAISFGLPSANAKTDASLPKVDSLSFDFGWTSPDAKDKYRTFAIYINTYDNQSVSSKETYVPCYISVDGMGQYPNLSLTGRIRGRGNSTWLWYDKKPYRIKFDTSNKLLGIKKNKDWVLLANYRDVTKMMNTFCFLAADYMGMPFTTPIRYAELFLNGEYQGVYQIAEQVEVGGNRVDISENGGLLLSLDVDDGPDYQPNSGDNFYSEVYKMPVCVKYPKNLDVSELSKIRSEFTILENAIKSHDYELVDSLMDLPSYIAEIQLQELVFNVELSAPRSVYFFRDAGGKWTFGPAWDWDAGFDFSWENMETSHKYFTSYSKSLLGSDPFSQNGEYKVPRFFTDMFSRSSFVKRYKEQWKAVSDSLLSHCWDETLLYVDGLNDVRQISGKSMTSPWKREQNRWPIRGYNPDTELTKMKSWLENRIQFLNSRISAYPDTVISESGAQMNLSATLAYADGFHQSTVIRIDKTALARNCGVPLSQLNASQISLSPINSDGTVGENTAAGLYGAWFDSNGDTTRWSDGEMAVFIESNDLFTWNCGLYQFNCAVGDEYTVRMRFSVNTLSVHKSVDVYVTFTVV